MEIDVSLDGDELDTLDVDPFLVRVGFGIPSSPSCEVTPGGPDRAARPGPSCFREIAMRLLALTLAPLFLVLVATGHVAAQSEHPWTLRTRALLVGANAESDPVGLDLYSAFTVEADISRRFGRHFAVELILASASHEVTSTVDGVEVPLGSVELLPPTLLAQYHFLPEARVHPYIGAGVNLSIFYEKSGDLDALDLATKVAPAAQAGVDVDLSDRMMLNFDVKWIWLETTLENQGVSLAELTIDPFILGAGVGFRF